MRTYIVVAHRTLGGAHLIEHLRELRNGDPYCRFHFIVPEHHPSDHTWTESEVWWAAKRRLDAILEHMAMMGMGASGEVGDANPVYAIGVTLRRDRSTRYAGIILSTLPKRLSLWWDVPKRINREFPGIRLTHLVADDSLVPG